MKKIHTLVAVVGIALAGGVAWWLQNKAKPEGGAAVAQGADLPGAGGSAAQRGPGAGPGGTGGAGGGAGAAGGPVAVEVGQVESVTLTDDAQAIGSLRSRQSVVLRPEISGRVAKLEFKDGQRVKRGQLLVQLDDTLQQAQMRQAQAQESIARTNLQRSRELLAQNFVSQSAVDQNAAALEVAQAQVALAQAQLLRMRILAPFDAVTGIRTANVGDYLKDGADIVTLEDDTSVWVDFRLPERFLANVKSGQAVDVAFDAMPGRSFKAVVEALDAQVDANGRALLVRARLPNPKGEFKSGMFARTRIVFSVREAALVVPEEALVPLGGKQYLVKVVDGAPGGGGGGGKARMSQRLEAKIGLRLPGKVEILEGLAAGDTVVTAGHGRLMRGDPQPVRVIDLARAGDARGPASAAASKPGGRPASGGVSSSGGGVLLRAGSSPA